MIASGVPRFSGSSRQRSISAKGSRFTALQANAASPSSLAALRSRGVSESYQFPLSFEPNQRQTAPQVKFLARGDGYILFLTDQETVLRLGQASRNSSVLRMSFQGTKAKPRFAGMDELPGKSNYFIGNQPSQWRTNIPNYRKVAERGIYPGIDLVYYGTQRQLEYDFVVSPGAAPDKIQIAFAGAQSLRPDSNGDLVVKLAGSGDVRLHKPVAYQEIGGERRLVAANYVLSGADSVAFAIGDYDARHPLIVDPILSYSTYLGGSGIDGANAIAVAPDNTAFVAGSTSSSDFPTVHALQPNDGGNPDFPQDAFVSKISSDGSTLLYSTYLGGENRDAANGIAVDNFGDAFVIGTTLSPHFPVTTNSFDTLCGADGQCGASWDGGALVTNAFVTKLNPAGSALVYSTFYGYFENVSGEAIAVDTNGNAYLTGYTTANFVPTVVITPPKLPPPPFPITASAFQTAYGGGTTNAFVAKLDATGSTALYSSYLGGSIEDAGYGIAVDASADVSVTGLTYSPDFPTTAGALQRIFGGAGDAFVARVNMNAFGAASLLYSTYLGGSGLDQGNGIAVDTAGNAYVTGVTNSASFGFAPNGFQTANAGEGDAFVAKLTTAGALSYFTYLGGSHADAGTGIAVDSGGNAYLTGTTVSTDFPTAGAVFQPAYGGGNADSFVAKLDPTGKTLIYSSYLGGTNTELASGIAVDTSGSAYVTGQTCSEDFPLANPLQAVPGGNCDAYVAKVSILSGFAFNPAGLVFSAQSLNTTSQPQTVTVTNGDIAETISSITLSGANAADFAETTTCGSSLAVGATCGITVTFTPTAEGIRKASVVIVDSAPGSPHLINLTGNTSTVTLSTSSLTFGPQNVGTSSVPQDVTVTNSGTTPLIISGIVASGDFSETDDCTRAPLQPSTNCVIAVTFTPSAGISSIGAVTIADNGSGSPQVILVTGTGVPQAPFTVSSLTPTTAVPAGQTAQYVLSVSTASGFGQAVGLTCTAPKAISCSISPSTVTPSAGPGPAALLTLGTALRTAVPPGTGIKIDPRSLLGHFGGTWLLSLAAVLAICALAAVRRRPMTAAFGFAVVLLLASVACSGGNTPGVPGGTPAGTYQVTVTGTSGSVTSSTTLTLQVM
jgi:beta-propeller repeat-containing protein